MIVVIIHITCNEWRAMDSNSRIAKKKAKKENQINVTVYRRVRVYVVVVGVGSHSFHRCCCF
jgi:hypothetical protein